MAKNKVIPIKNTGIPAESSPASRMVPCPTCRQPTPFTGNPLRPFCSERCKMQDLGAWANEEYRVASKEESVSTSDGNDES